MASSSGSDQPVPRLKYNEGPAVEVQVPPCHHPPPQVSHGTLLAHPPPQDSHGTLLAHLPQEIWYSQRRDPLPAPSRAPGDISGSQVFQSAPSRPGNQATPSPHHAMLVSPWDSQTEDLSYPSLSGTVSGSQTTSDSPSLSSAEKQGEKQGDTNVQAGTDTQLVRTQTTGKMATSQESDVRLTADGTIADLVSMGFELEDAQDAIQHGKTSTQEAVEWILAEKPGAVVVGAQAPSLDSTADGTIAEVMSMGFELQDAEDAMQHAKMSTQEAVDWILAGKPDDVIAGAQPGSIDSCCKCKTESECNTNDCDCRSTLLRCDAGCRAERCSNSKVTTELTECCWCNEDSECNTEHCDCHGEGEECTNCVTRSCKLRYKCCQCNTESECNTNDDCDCRSKLLRCKASCLAERCSNSKVTAALTECCPCNEESECNSNNCACHSRHTRCSANCFAGGCTNSKLTGECKECCQCNEESQCDSENCACHSKESHCSSRCFATGCGNHKIVMGQKVDPYLLKEQVQVLAKSQTTSDAERKTTRPITLDTTQTSSIPASCQGSAPDNETEFLNAWFPRLDTQPYIIPPVHFDTVHVRKVNLAGGHSIKVLKTQEEREQGQDKSANKTVKIDRILQKIHYCLSHIKKEAAKQRELMVIMSQAKCSLYGANSTSLYTGAAAMSTNSSDSETLDLREEFVDLLVIHRQQGILMAATIPTTEENLETLQGDIRKAVDYLEKAKQVVEDYVVNAVTPKPAIHRAVLLPNVSRDCLQGQLVKISDLRELEQRLGVEPGRSFSEFFLCEDDMADETRVERWWTTCLKRDVGADRPMMGQDVYRQLVTKFVTPLTTVQMYLSTEPRLRLWTLHDVVQAVGEEHGRDLSRIALFPRQLELVEDLPDQNKDDVIILYGPPGSAKTFLLLIKGVLWLKERCKKVFVVQTRPKDGAASAFLVAHQLEKTAAQGPNSVQLVNTQDFWDSEKETWTQGGEVKYQAWVQQLCDHARDNPTGAVHILADEANCDHVSSIVKTLHHRGVRVNLWAAGVKLDIPADLQDNVRMLTEPLRSPPSVVREVEKADDMKDSTVPAYSVPPVAPPCDGPPLITIRHYMGRQGHEAGSYPWRCEKCAKQVARVLLHDLHVGRRDNAVPGLKYNDVFVTGSEIDCGTNTPDNHRYSPAPFIRGLRSAGIPTRQVSRNDRDAIRRVAENAWPATATGATGGGEDAVTVVNERTVWGLERKVVVYMETAGTVGAGINADYFGRLLSFSRATSQVIFVQSVH